MGVWGTGEFRYNMIDNWAMRPIRWPFTDVVGVGIDSQDRVYVLNRGPHPVMVFDSEGLFVQPHGISIGPNDAIWCTDDMDHAVRKFDVDGNLLMTIGNPRIFSDTGYDG